MKKTPLTPLQLASTRTHQNTESINEQVVPVICPKDLHLAAILPEGHAVEEQEDFGTEGGSDGYDGGDVEVVGFGVAVVGDDGADGFDYDDQVDGAHSSGSRDVC